MIESGSRVLVTGGGGFIGGRLVERLMLDGDITVRVLVRDPSRAVRAARFPLELVPGDLSDDASVRRAVRGCDVVVNCAHDMGSARGHWSSGYHGTQHLGNAALHEGVARLVHLSSLAVYGPTLAGNLSEQTPWQPTRDPYARAKRAGEQAMLTLYRDAGLPVSVLQPTIVYGPFGKVWTTGRVDDLRSGVVPLLDGGTGLCNAVYVDDVVDAILLAVARPQAVGERFLISASEPVTWREFYRAFEDLLGFRATVEVSSNRLRSLQRVESRRARRQLMHTAAEMGKQALRQPETVQAALSLRTIRATADMAARLLPENRWRVLKGRLRGDASSRTQAAGPRRRIHVPDATLAALYRSRTEVRTDKARELLGYCPRVDFARGMELTGEYLRWAGLA